MLIDFFIIDERLAKLCFCYCFEESWASFPYVDPEHLSCPGYDRNTSKNWVVVAPLKAIIAITKSLISHKTNKEAVPEIKDHNKPIPTVIPILTHHPVTDLEAIEKQAQSNQHSQIHNKNILQNAPHIPHPIAQLASQIILKTALVIYHAVSSGGTVRTEPRVIK